MNTFVAFCRDRSERFVCSLAGQIFVEWCPLLASWNLVFISILLGLFFSFLSLLPFFFFSFKCIYSFLSWRLLLYFDLHQFSQRELRINSNRISLVQYFSLYIIIQTIYESTKLLSSVYNNNDIIPLNQLSATGHYAN